MARSTLICACAVLCLLFIAPAAEAAECGSKPEGQDEPLAGTLLLKAEDSTTELNFKRDKSPLRLIFVFEVRECKLNSSNGLEAKIRSSDLDVGSVFGKATIEAEGSDLSVEISVDPNEFDAGKHTASATLRGAPIVPTAVKVTVQRTDPWFWPTAIFVVCALLGFGVAVVIKATEGDGLPWEGLKRWVRLGGALVPAVIAAGAVWKTGYLDADVWKLEFSTFLAMVIGALPAAFGAATVALKGE